jgi:nicotinamidase-related amidase
MPAKNEDLHGNVPDNADIALLMIDVINDLEYPGGDELLQPALVMAERLAEFKRRAKAAHVPVIYVNDNFQKWQEDFRKQVEHCLKDGVRGKSIVELLKPDEDDYFVLKPKHSGFYSTVLDTLLLYLQVKTLVLTGLTGNMCVLFTANDAYLRDYNLVVPADCIASITPEDNEYSLRHLKNALKADITPSTDLDWAELKGRASQSQNTGPNSQSGTAA